MDIHLTEAEIKNQSISCYSQWCVQWREHATFHGTRFAMNSLNDLMNTGIGKAALCIANGYSFEENIETIKKYQNNVDIIACDKTVRHCIENGIKPKYVVVCDANVSYERYLEPVKDQLADTTLIINVCAATNWAICGNWKKVYFFVNQDVLKSEKEFMALSGCPNVLVAATNVSSQMIVALTQADNQQNRNLFGYDRYLLIGFDYSWEDNYYAFDKDGAGKHNYMRNIYLKNLNGDLTYTSTNLFFSARWFEGYLKAFKHHVYQCSKRSIVAGNYGYRDLAKEMQYLYRPEDSQFVQKLVRMKYDLSKQIHELDQKLGDIAFDHFKATEAY